MPPTSTTTARARKRLLAGKQSEHNQSKYRRIDLVAAIEYRMHDLKSTMARRKSVSISQFANEAWGKASDFVHSETVCIVFQSGQAKNSDGEEDRDGSIFACKQVVQGS